MKFISTQLSYFFNDRQVQRNVRSLLRYILFVIIVIVLFAEIFHLIMVHVEGEDHSWVTGLYWTLTVMSTLGFGDITFESDPGRIFSIIVMVTGVVLLLIVLPFAFIRFFYAPWLEARIRSRAPREVPAGMTGHVILCSYDTFAEGLIARLIEDGIPYVVLETDPTRAADHHLDGVTVVTGPIDSVETYARLNLERARLLVANREDTTNTNIILTAHEVCPTLPIAAIAGKKDSIDVLELSGATHVLPLRMWLGEQLACRVNATRAKVAEVGEYRDLRIAEFAVDHTPLVGSTIRETRLRERLGLSIIGVWKRGHLHPARPDEILSEGSVPVVIGDESAMEKLGSLFLEDAPSDAPVVVIGGGSVGRAAVEALTGSGAEVTVIEQIPEVANRLRGLCRRVLTGDAADYDLLVESGILEASAVLLSTNDDAMNIYLASYCRHLNEDLRIISRITHARNVESIHRAGADFVLSYDSLGIAALRSILKGRELIVMGEGVDLFTIRVPPSLVGKTIAGTGIGARTGLIIIALQKGDWGVTNPSADTIVPDGAELVMIGDTGQRRALRKMFEE